MKQILLSLNIIIVLLCSCIINLIAVKKKEIRIMNIIHIVILLFFYYCKIIKNTNIIIIADICLYFISYLYGYIREKEFRIFLGFILSTITTLYLNSIFYLLMKYNLIIIIILYIILGIFVFVNIGIYLYLLYKSEMIEEEKNVFPSLLSKYSKLFNFYSFSIIIFLYIIGIHKVIDIEIISVTIIYIAFLNYYFYYNKLNILNVKYNNIQSDYKSVIEYVSTIRCQRHDFNIHLQSIMAMIDKNKYKECKQYLQSLYDDRNNVGEVIGIADPAISSMLYAFKKNALNYNIHINYIITTDLSKNCCNHVDFNIIIGNVIKNSIEELASQEDILDKKVDVYIFERGLHYILRISNIFLNKEKVNLSNIYKYGISNKKNHTGLGLYNAKRLVNKYKGRLYSEIEDNIYTCIVVLPKKN